ncbi:hypothetical protein PMIN04_008663 [Paraphaeosphaeria minitans]
MPVHNARQESTCRRDNNDYLSPSPRASQFDITRFLAPNLCPSDTIFSTNLSHDRFFDTCPSSIQSKPNLFNPTNTYFLERIATSRNAHRRGKHPVPVPRAHARGTADGRSPPATLELPISPSPSPVL